MLKKVQKGHSVSFQPKPETKTYEWLLASTAMTTKEKHPDFLPPRHRASIQKDE
jgi:hypothetical protein